MQWNDGWGMVQALGTLLSCLVSLLAILIAGWALKQNRDTLHEAQQSRMDAANPLITIHLVHYDKGGSRPSQVPEIPIVFKVEPHLKFKLKNAGFGPASNIRIRARVGERGLSVGPWVLLREEEITRDIYLQAGEPSGIVGLEGFIQVDYRDTYNRPFISRITFNLEDPARTVSELQYHRPNAS